MNPTDLILAVVLIAAVYALLEARDWIAEAIEAKGDARYWIDYTCWLEGRQSHPKSARFTPEQAAKFIHDLKYGFADEQPPVCEGKATYGTVDEFAPTVLPE